jgi:serine/threonine protein kinase
MWKAPNMVISQTTNIYQVGLIMASAIRLLNPLPENNWRRPPSGYRVPPANQLHHDGVNAPAIGVHELSSAQLNPGPKKYSDELVDLVWQCLRHNCAQRPTSAQLLQEIQTWANFQGMDTAVDPLTAPQKQLCIDLDKVRYAVGSHR